MLDPVGRTHCSAKVGSKQRSAPTVPVDGPDYRAFGTPHGTRAWHWADYSRYDPILKILALRREHTKR